MVKYPTHKDFNGKDVGPGTICTAEEGKTRDSEKDQADINKIMKRFEMTGVLPVDQRTPQFLDVASAPDYRTALDRINTINRSFMEMPADVRARFDNDPAVLLDAVGDPAREAELIELGILPAKPVAAVPHDGTPPAVPAVPAPAP